MTETSNDLSGLKLPQLQELASSLGVAGISKLRKGELVAAIEAARGGAAAPAPNDAPAADAAPAEAPASEAAPGEAEPAADGTTAADASPAE